MISIVIPAYNEEKRLPKTLEKINQYFSDKNWAYEIIVVDDGSTDNTKSIIKSAPNIKTFVNPSNKGKGYSVRRGIGASEGDYILFTDADLSTPIEEIEKLLAYINKSRPFYNDAQETTEYSVKGRDKEYDITIGSRSIKGAKIILHQPVLRELMGKFFNKIVRLVTVHGIIDTQCGFKLFTKESAKKIFSVQKLNGFSFDVEALFIGKKLGYKIKEVPIIWHNSPQTRVKILKDPLLMLLDLIKIRINEFTGIYRYEQK